MLKFVFVILFVSKFGGGFEVFELQEFGRQVRNLSLTLFHLTERDANDQLVMAPYTIWNLISLVAFTTSAESWTQFYSVIGVSKINEQYINSLYQSFTNSLSRKSVGALFETKLNVFYDVNIELSQPFIRSIQRTGVHLSMLNFHDALTSELANEYTRLPGDLRLKRTMFNKADFEDSSVIVSGVVKFKGDWSLPFDKSNTIRKDGYNDSIYMMRQRASVFYDDVEMLSASVMLLPYGNNRDFNMIIIRPHENVQINSVLENFAKMSLSNIFEQLYDQGFKEMDIELPKFSLTSLLVLNNPFKSMGVVDIFEPEQANFSDLSASEDMYIFNIEHRTIITVSEEGTIARAFTPGNLAKGTRVSKPGMAPPFLFFIVHVPTMTIVFCEFYKIYHTQLVAVTFTSALFLRNLRTVSFSYVIPSLSNHRNCKPVQLWNLPPTSAAAHQHFKHMYYQVQAWLGHDLEPHAWGWKVLPRTYHYNSTSSSKSIAEHNILQDGMDLDTNVVECENKKELKFHNGQTTMKKKKKRKTKNKDLEVFLF